MDEKEKFVEKWSTWWILNDKGKELTEAFKKELNDLLKKNNSPLEQPTIYQVKIGRTSKKGNFVELHNKIIKFDGNVTDLYNIFANRYSGFNIQVSPVKKIETILPKKLSKSDTLFDMPTITITIPITNHVPEFYFENYINTSNELANIKKDLELRIKDSLMRRMEISEVKKIKFINEYAKVTLKLNGELYLKK